MCVDLQLKWLLKFPICMNMQKAAQFFTQFSNVRLLKIRFVILKNVSCKIKKKAISIGGLLGF
jgi:hypothetical protein